MIALPISEATLLFWRGFVRSRLSRGERQTGNVAEKVALLRRKLAFEAVRFDNLLTLLGVALSVGL